MIPQVILHFQLLPHPAGGVITIAQEGFYYLPKLDGTWTLLSKKMASPRTEHVAFWIPDSMTDCDEKGGMLVFLLGSARLGSLT